MTRNQLLNGDSGEVLKGIPDHTFDACVTDPPYGLGTREPTGPEIDSYLAGHSGIDTGGDFMGKSWDIPAVALWREVYRTMKPGGVVMAFAGTRTLDLMAAGIEAAGFQYVGTLAWMHGQGFPKSLNVGKFLDKMAGAEREVIKPGKGFDPEKHSSNQFTSINPSNVGINTPAFIAKIGEITAPATEEAKKWDGWGTALKPAWEPVLVFTKGESSWRMPQVPFCYAAKPAKSERGVDGEVDNDHVTVKPVKVMEWLVDLSCPKGSLVLEPFLGSGTTAVACVGQGRDFVGIERDPHYFELASKRVGVVKGRSDEVRRQRDAFDYMSELPEE